MKPISDELRAKLDVLGDPIRELRLRKENICLLGFTDHRRLALELPHDEWALVGLNELYRYMPVERFDLWMELHPWPLTKMWLFHRYTYVKKLGTVYEPFGFLVGIA